MDNHTDFMRIWTKGAQPLSARSIAPLASAGFDVDSANATVEPHSIETS